MKTTQQGFVGLVLLFAGCVAAAPSTSESTAAATGPATVTTDAVAYTYATPVTVTWAGLNGTSTDWIALAPQGSALTTTTRWAYTGGATSGSRTLEGPTPGGTYVARAFDNDSYTLMGEGDPFTVADSSATMATVSVDQTDYAIDQPIVVTWSGLPPNQLDWVAISPQNAPDTTEALWLYTGGTASGSVAFPRGLRFSSQQGFPGGYYVARLYLNDTYTRVAETPAFLVGAIVSTDLTSYAAHQPITVNWTHLPGGPDDWVALSPLGSRFDVVTNWLYTGGAANGSRTFSAGLPMSGQYVARAYAPNTYFIAGESATFAVTAGATVTLTTDMNAYTLGQTITVTWAGLPGNQHDWISLAPNGSSDQTVTRWIYAGGMANGSFTFEGPPVAGAYVARAYLNDTYVKLVEGTAFPVN